MRPSSILLYAALLAPAACGSVNTLSDAPGNGSNIDANTGPDADPHGVVTVTVLNTDQSGTVVQGVPVVFFNPDGSMVGKSSTDAKGQASATVLPGANVSVVWPRNATSYQIATIYAIKPNDNLVVGFRNPDETDVGTVNASFDLFGGATSYHAYGPCGQDDSDHVLHFQAGCKTDPFDAYMLAFNSSNQVIGWNSKPGISFASGAVNFDTAGWNFANQMTVSYTNLSADIQTINVNHTSGYPGGYSTTASGSPTGATMSVAIPNTPGGGTYAYVASSIARKNGGGQQVVRQRIAGASSTYGLDVGGSLLPWLSAPKFDPVAQQFSITADGTGTYDLFLMDTSYSRVVGQATITYEWIAIGPTIGTLTLPALPADVGDVNPKATDKLGNAIGLLIDDDGDGYDSVRQHVFDEFRGAILSGLPSKQLRISISQGLGK
jgi:hypothetical protein